MPLVPEAFVPALVIAIVYSSGTSRIITSSPSSVIVAEIKAVI